VEPFRLGAGDLDVTGKAAAEATVELWAAPVGGGALTKVDETEADADGDYSFTVTFEETGYRLQTKATGLLSDIKVVWLKHDPVMTSTSASKRAVTLRTFGDPKLAGLTVVIQRYVDGEWVKVGTGTTNAKGMYTRTFTNLPSRVGVTHRAYIVGDEDLGLAGGYSKYTRVIVK
jgi:ribosomal protein L21E